MCQAAYHWPDKKRDITAELDTPKLQSLKDDHFSIIYSPGCLPPLNTGHSPSRCNPLHALHSPTCESPYLESFVSLDADTRSDFLQGSCPASLHSSVSSQQLPMFHTLTCNQNAAYKC